MKHILWLRYLIRTILINAIIIVFSISAYGSVAPLTIYPAIPANGSTSSGMELPANVLSPFPTLFESPIATGSVTATPAFPTASAESTETADATQTANNTTSKPTVSATDKPIGTPTPTPTPKPDPHQFQLVIYQGSQSVVAYTKDDSGAFTQVARVMICSTGAGNATPNGNFAISAKYRYRQLIGAKGQYCSRIVGGVLFHSVPILDSASNLDEAKSLMSVSAYKRLGHKASHGCVRMLVRDAKWIYDNCPIGTSVKIVSQSGPAAGGPPALTLGVPYTNAQGSYGWDPTDPDPANPYHNQVTAEPSPTPEEPTVSPTTAITATPTLVPVTASPTLPPVTATPTSTASPTPTPTISVAPTSTATSPPSPTPPASTSPSSSPYAT